MDRKKQKELFGLVTARHDGLVGPEADRRLAELLEGDADAQRYYLELGTIFQELEETYHADLAGIVAEDFPVRRARIIPFAGWATAIAASIAVVLALIPPPDVERTEFMVDADSTVLIDEDRYIARVVGSNDVEWGPDNTVVVVNDELKHGMLDLAGGTLDVVYDNGVRFGFAAPVKMDLSSLKRLSLESGSVVVDVPGLAEGLAISTPDAVLTMNTALMQIQCGGQEPTKVHVERGAVDLFTENDEGMEVRQNMVGQEAVLIARGTDDPVSNTRFVTEQRIDLSQPAELDELQFVHYSFDSFRGETVPNEGNIPNADGWVAGIPAYPEFPAPRIVPGRFSSALEFTGHNEGMLADLKDFGSDEPGSVAFWIKMEPATVPDPYETIFTWHMYTDSGKRWHTDDDKELASSIHINDNPENGVVGAVWIGFRDKWICGSKDLRDGRWHHVTAVFHRGYQGTIIRHYVDGKLARSSARGKTWFPKQRNIDIGGGSISVGRVYWPQRPKVLSRNDAVGLRGMLDEVYVFKQPVLPSQVASLYSMNSPHEPVDTTFAPDLTTAIALIFPF